MIKKIINLTTNLKREVKGILMKKKTIKVTMITIIEGEEEKEEEEERRRCRTRNNNRNYKGSCRKRRRRVRQFGFIGNR